MVDTKLVDTSNIREIEMFKAAILALKVDTNEVGAKFLLLLETIPKDGCTHGRGSLLAKVFKLLIAPHADIAFMPSFNREKPKAFSTLNVKEKKEFQQAVSLAMTMDVYAGRLKTLVINVCIVRIEDLKKSASSLIPADADSNSNCMMNKGNIFVPVYVPMLLISFKLWIHIFISCIQL